MNKRGKWSASLLGLLLAGMSGMSMADRGQGAQVRPGGQGAQVRPGGRDAQVRPGGRDPQVRPGGRDAQARPGRSGRPGGYDRHDGRTHWGVGVVVNPFWYDSWYYPRPYYYSPYDPYYYPPYYYPPAVVTVPATPPVYIEREDDSAAAPGASAYWYYCADPQGYYPDVKECPGGWRAVSPQPDGEER